MLERRDRPLGCGVTRCTVLAKEAKVFIFRTVAARTIEFRFKLRNEWSTIRQKPALRLTGTTRFIRNHLDPNSRQRFMVHHTKIRVRPLMLRVT